MYQLNKNQIDKETDGNLYTLFVSHWLTVVERFVLVSDAVAEG